MNHRGAREVLEAHLVEPAAAPHPGARYRVDEGGENNRECPERPQLDPLKNGARHDRCGGSHKQCLEEEARHRRAASRHYLVDAACRPVEQHRLRLGGPLEHLQRAYESVDADVHEAVTHKEVRDARDRINPHVLEADHRCVLGANRAGLKHREPGAHPHHQRAPHQERERVENELDVQVRGGRGIIGLQPVGGIGQDRPESKQQQRYGCCLCDLSPAKLHPTQYRRLDAGSLLPAEPSDSTPQPRPPPTPRRIPPQLPMHRLARHSRTAALLEMP